MKQTISLLLALALCLSLCACGADQKYTALLDHLDAGNYEGIKSEMSSLSSDFAADAALLSKYADLIHALENEDYEAALVDVQSRVPVPEEPPFTEIEITIDNWDDYFVIEEKEIWHTNAFGEIDDFHIDVVISIKPEYADRVAKKENAKINHDISYDSISQTVEIDYASQTYTLLDYFTERKNFHSIGTWDCSWLVNERSVIDTFIGGMTINDIPCLSYFENVTVERIQGILCLYDA